MRGVGRIGSLFLVGALVLAGCSSSPGGKGGTDVKIGAVLSLKGNMESLGGPERQGIELAVDELNAAGGVGGKTVSLTVYDDEGDQAKSVQLANRLISENKVVALFGPSITPTAEMVSPLLEESKIVQMGFVAQRYLWEKTKYIFMSLPGDEVNAEAMVRYAVKNVGAKNLGVVYANVPYGVNGNNLIAESAKALDAQVVVAEKWGESDWDFTAQVNNVKKANPGAILIWGSGTNSDAQMIKALREGGLSVPIIGNMVIPGPQTVAVAGKHAEGVRAFSVVDYARPDAETTKFLTGFTKKFPGVTPSPLAATAYDGVWLWAKAVEKAGGKSDPDSVSSAMIGLDHKGVSGLYQMRADNHHGLSVDSEKPIIVKNGEWVSE